MSALSLNASKKTKQTPAGEIPVDWGCVKGEEITNLIGKGSSPRWQGFEYSQDGALFVTSENVRDGYLDVSRPKYLPLGFHEKQKRTKLKEGDILINLVDAARPNLSLSDLRNFPIPLPPLPEQRKIADILGTWDTALEKLDALIAAKTRRKQALMQQLLTGKKRLPGFSGEWDLVKIGDLFKEVKRPVAWDDEHLYQLVSVRRRSGSFFFRTPLHGRDIKTKVMFTTKAADFVISKMQVLHGALAMTPKEFDGAHVSGSYITLVPKDKQKLHVPFFDWLSRTPKLYHLAYISSYGVVIEKMTFVLKDYFKHEVRIPPNKEEQIAIAQVLDTADHELRLLKQQRTALEKQKRGLMQQLLTGKIRMKSC